MSLSENELQALIDRLDAELPDVHTAINRVMKDVQAIGKTQEYKGPSGRTEYRFRGIDDVLDAVGPVFRTHGVIAAPVKAKLISAERYETKSGARMQNVIVEMRYEITGPRGDKKPATTMGQASDAGDKAIPKAQSVAYRDMLCELLCIPTGVADPGSEQHEAAAPGQTQDTTQAHPGPSVGDQITQWMVKLNWNKAQVYDAYSRWNGGALLNEANVTDRATFVEQLAAEHGLQTRKAERASAPKTNVPPDAHVAGGPYPDKSRDESEVEIDRLRDSLGWDNAGLANAYARWNGGRELRQADQGGRYEFLKQLRHHLEQVQRGDAAATQDMRDRAAEADRKAASDEPPF